MFLGADVVAKTVDLISSEKATTRKQPNLEEKAALKLNPENCRIDWTASLNKIDHKIRGLNPFPTAWSEMNNKGSITSLKIYKVRKEIIAHKEQIKTIITTKKDIKVAVKGGYIYIEELKVSGKKKMDSKSLLNGFHFHSNAKML